MNNPLVSICLPVYNCERYLVDTLNSLINQTYTNLEFIFVDDHSSDNSNKIISDYITRDKRIQLYPNEGKGACCARNLAYKKSKGVLIMFMDSDDIMPLNCIQDHVKIHLNNNCYPDLVSFSTVTEFIDGEPIPTILNTKRSCIHHDETEGWKIVTQMWETGISSRCHCYLMNRKLVEKTGPWNENLIKNQDGEFYERLLLNAGLIKFNENTSAIYRYRPTGSLRGAATKESAKSQFESYKSVIPLLLSKQNSERVYKAIVNKIGWWIYMEYPFNRPYIREAKKLLKNLNQKIIIPYNRPVFSLFRKIFGWRTALYIAKNPAVMKIYSFLNLNNKF